MRFKNFRELFKIKFYIFFNVFESCLRNFKELYAFLAFWFLGSAGLRTR